MYVYIQSKRQKEDFNRSKKTNNRMDTYPLYRRFLFSLLIKCDLVNVKTINI